MRHIFRDSKGHLPNTKTNQQQLQNLANDKNNYLGADKFGNHWYSKTNPDGSQLWAQVRNGEIINGGLNAVPRQYNLSSGLSNPNKLTP